MQNLRCWTRVAGLAVAMLAPQFAIGADEPFETHYDVVYAERDGVQLAADVYIPREGGLHPGVLVVHGGAWMMGDRDQLAEIARRLASSGFTAVAISYRLAPKHPFPSQIEDCRDAVRWMRTQAKKYKIDPTRIGGFGYSAGGHLVALLGAMGGDPDQHSADQQATGEPQPSMRLQAVVAGGAPCDFRLLPPANQMLAYWLGGSRAEQPDNYKLASPAQFVSRDDPPMFFFHGEKDAVVPLLSPVAMNVLLKLAGVPSQVFTVAGAGHIGAAHDEQALAAAFEFFQVHLQQED